MTMKNIKKGLISVLIFAVFLMPMTTYAAETDDMESDTDAHTVMQEDITDADIGTQIEFEDNAVDFDTYEKDGTLYFVNPVWTMSAEDIQNVEDSLDNVAITVLADNIGTFSDVDSAAEAVRSMAVKKESAISFRYTGSADLTSLNDSLVTILNKTMQHTGTGNEGDYLRLDVNGISCPTPENENAPYDVTLIFDWRTSASEEAEIDTKLSEIYESFDWQGCMTDEAEIRDIYQWIEDNVEYDYDIDESNMYDPENIKSFTPYGALFNNKCVCQGYACLLYRMANDNNIDCRIVIGHVNTGGSHGWNMTEVGGKYYFCDATWDTLHPDDWKYFLIGSVTVADGMMFNQSHIYDMENSSTIYYDISGYTVQESSFDGTSVTVKHAYDNDWITVKEATCTEDGAKQRTCDCGEETENASIAALGHDWIQNSDGITMCARCGEIDQTSVSDSGDTKSDKEKTETELTDSETESRNSETTETITEEEITTDEATTATVETVRTDNADDEIEETTVIENTETESSAEEIIEDTTETTQVETDEETDEETETSVSDIVSDDEEVTVIDLVSTKENEDTAEEVVEEEETETETDDETGKEETEDVGKEDTEEAGKEDTTSENSDVSATGETKTGDTMNFILWTVIGLMATGGCTAGLAVYRKRSNVE